MPGGAARRQYGVLSPGRAGDFLLTTGLYNAIKAHDRDIELTVVVGPRAGGMARAHPAIDRVLVFDRHPLRILPFFFRLRDRVFDAWLDPKDHFSRNQTIIAQAVRARVKVGFNRPGGGPFQLLVRPPTDPMRHFSEMMMAPLDLLGVPWTRPPRLSIGVPEAAEARAAGVVGARAPFEVFVNISAGLPIRYWTEAKWIELLPLLAAERSTRFWLSAAPEDREPAARIEQAAAARGVQVRRTPAGSILDVAALVRQMDAVLTVDTSIVHLAAIFDRPIVALYRDKRPECDQFRPLSTRQRVLFSSPAGLVAEIEVQDVAQAWRELLSEL